MVPNPPSGITKRSSLPPKKRIEYPLYFMACEGGTEIIYFTELQRYLWQNNIWINIRFLDRTYSERSCTSPEELLSLLYEEKDFADFSEITVEKIIRKVDHWMREENILPDFRIDGNAADELISRMERRGHHSRKVIKFDDIQNGSETQLFVDLDICIRQRLEKIISEYNMEDFKNYLKDNLKNIGYEEGDKLCLVCDRDFYDDSVYNNALKHCREDNIGFYITNPCFEFWILLHFDEILNLEKDALLENEWVESSVTHTRVRLAFSEVEKLLPGYTKSNIQFPALQTRIKHAVDYEKTFFSEDEEELKTKLGSRIGILVSELLSYQPQKN